MSAKGDFSDGSRMWEVGANDQLFKAIDYRPLIHLLSEWIGSQEDFLIL